MRMRRKRNLEPRLLACGKLLIARGRPCLNLKEAEEHFRALVDYKELFGNDNPLELEIGCGNGGFITALSQREQNKNYLAVELCSNVILTAIERVQSEKIENVRFLNIPAEILLCYLPEESVQTIYLNFSTPLPEKSREKQRLTSPRFLKIYRKLLKKGGKIVQKTDSEPFFDYSIQTLTENGFCVSDVTRDLHRSEWAQENIVTEYEQNFVNEGLSICRLVATKGE